MNMHIFLNEHGIIKNADIAKSMFSRMKGLLGRKSIPLDYAMIIPRCNSIHTFFMSVSIDVIMLDKKGYVIFIKGNMAGARIAVDLKAKDTIEFGAGAIKAFNIKKGDLITYK